MEAVTCPYMLQRVTSFLFHEDHYQNKVVAHQYGRTYSQTFALIASQPATAATNRSESINTHAPYTHV